MLLRDSSWTANIAQCIVDVLEERMGYELLAVLVASGPGSRMRPLALSKQGQDTAFLEADKAYVETRCSSPGLGLTNWVARTGKSVRVGNVAEDSRYFGIRGDIQSELCVPLLVDGEMIGVINTETATPNAYGAADQRFLETAASHIALAIKYSQRQELGLGHVGRSGRGSPLSTSCMYCKSMRMGKDNWVSPEEFLLRRLGVVLSHGVCPSCDQGWADKGLLE